MLSHNPSVTHLDMLIKRSRHPSLSISQQPTVDQAPEVWQQKHILVWMNRLFLVLLSTTLGLLGTSELLRSVLPLLSLLSGSLLDLGCVANPHEPVSGFKLLHGFDGVVDESESCGLATTILSSHTEDVDLVCIGLVHFGETLSKVILGDVGSVWVQDVAGDHVSVFLLSEVNSQVTLTRIFCGTVATYTTICFRERSLLVMNFRVLIVTGWSAEVVAMLAIFVYLTTAQSNSDCRRDLTGCRRRRRENSLATRVGKVPTTRS